MFKACAAAGGSQNELQTSRQTIVIAYHPTEWVNKKTPKYMDYE